MTKRYTESEVSRMNQLADELLHEIYPAKQKESDNEYAEQLLAEFITLLGYDLT